MFWSVTVHFREDSVDFTNTRHVYIRVILIIYVKNVKDYINIALSCVIFYIKAWALFASVRWAFRCKLIQKDILSLFMSLCYGKNIWSTSCTEKKILLSKWKFDTSENNLVETRSTKYLTISDNNSVKPILTNMFCSLNNTCTWHKHNKKHGNTLIESSKVFQS